MKKQIEVGDEFQVDFIKNQNGGKPICRIDGMVGFIDQKEKSFVAPCSQWIVEVIEVRQSCLIVLPLVKTHTAKERQVDFESKLQSLRKPKTSKQKQVKCYLYKSFSELQKS